MTKCIQPEQPFPDVLVAVYARTQRLFRVVEMEGDDLFVSDSLIQLPHRRTITPRSSDVISRSEDVTGIYADSEPFRLVHQLENLRQLFKPIAEVRALTRCRFKRDSDFASTRLSEDFIEAVGDGFQPGAFPGAQMRAGVHHDEWHTQALGAHDFVDQSEYRAA